MAKTIKFNLLCDNYPVRTIEDLQEHFNVEDVYEYYKNGLLHKWLKVRGYEEQLKKVEEINCQDAIEVLKELVKIFEILECEEEDLKMYEFKLRYEEKKVAVHTENETRKNAIKTYTDEYEELKQKILTASNDIEIIKLSLETIIEDYTWMFEHDYKNMFYTFYKNKAWLAIVCLLMNEKIREYMFERKSDDFEDEYREQMFKACWTIGEDYKIRDQLKDHYKCVTGLNTSEEWYRLEPQGKKYMILHMTGGSYIKLAGDETKETEEYAHVTVATAGLGKLFGINSSYAMESERKPENSLDYKDVNGKFPIVDGILYKSNCTMNSLYYMEV